MNLMVFGSVDPLAWLPCDKRGHFVVGAVIALVGLLLVGLVSPMLAPWIALVAVFVVEALYEAATWNRRDYLESALDFLATMAGALVPVLAVLVR